MLDRIWRGACRKQKAVADWFWYGIKLVALFVLALVKAIWEVLKAFGRWPTIFRSAWKGR